jgi:ganglioside GM2 activator
MRLPGNISVAFSGSLKVPLKAPLTLDLEVQKHVVFWITVPCIDHFGSCNYADVCQYIPLLKCPPIFQKYGIPCQCPIDAKTYTLPSSEIYIDDSAVPSLLADGDYRVTARLSQGKQNIACVYLEFSIEKS